MKHPNVKSPSSINLIYGVINFSFWILIVGLVSIIILNLLIWLNLVPSQYIVINLPLSIDLLNIDQLKFNSSAVPEKISSIDGVFYLWELEKSFIITFLTLEILSAVAFIYAIGLIRDLMKNVRVNSIFVMKNVMLLRRAGYLFILVWIFEDLILRNYVRIVHGFFNMTVGISTSYLSSILFIAIIILGISSIFERGVKLQNEQNLTI